MFLNDTHMIQFRVEVEYKKLCDTFLLDLKWLMTVLYRG